MHADRTLRAEQVDRTLRSEQSEPITGLLSDYTFPQAEDSRGSLTLRNVRSAGDLTAKPSVFSSSPQPSSSQPGPREQPGSSQPRPRE